MGYGVNGRNVRPLSQAICICGKPHRAQTICPLELQRLKTYADNITRLYNELRGSVGAVSPSAAPLAGDAGMLRLLERVRRVCHPDVNSSPLATEVTTELNAAIEQLRRRDV